MTREELSKEARARVAAGAALVDVRTPEEFARGHAPGARNIPLQELPRRLAEVGPAGTRVVVYCQAGMRAAQAKTLLERSGYPDVFNLLSVDNW
jgi:phage shock protein E